MKNKPILVIFALLFFSIGILAIIQQNDLIAMYSTWESGEAYMHFASFSLSLVVGMFFIIGILLLIAGIKK